MRRAALLLLSSRVGVLIWHREGLGGPGCPSPCGCPAPHVPTPAAQERGTQFTVMARGGIARRAAAAALLLGVALAALAGPAAAQDDDVVDPETGYRDDGELPWNVRGTTVPGLETDVEVEVANQMLKGFLSVAREINTGERDDSFSIQAAPPSVGDRGRPAAGTCWQAESGTAGQAVLWPGWAAGCSAGAAQPRCLPLSCTARTLAPPTGSPPNRRCLPRPSSSPAR